ncbi:hypothetical protein IW262DRAFT_646036 [Armillaria fumosa]|nr:hypothetical protein IW262DRAFT_646036 [Armillaria fumosa]
MSFSPVRRLPPEILFKIFLGTITFPVPRTRSNTKKDWWDFHPSESTLWSIELVCKTWRHAVLDFPELWSRINIFLSDDNFSLSNFRYVRRLGRQIARTRCHPLSILICAGSHQMSAEPLLPRLSPLLSTMQDRIESYYLYLPAAMFTFVATLQLYLPILRKLTLLSANDEELQKLSHLKLLGATPLLNDLDIVDIPNIVSAIDLPYHQITRYSTDVLILRFPFINTGSLTCDILSALLEVKDLEECDLRCDILTAQLENFLDISQSCQKLRALTLGSWSNEYPKSVLPQLLDALVVPHLSNLKVRCHVNHGRRGTDETFTAIRRLISRSQSPLTTFYFTHGDIDEEDLLLLFRSASSTLQEVHLHNVGPNALPDSILTPLVISNADNVLLPRLHTLNINGVMEFNTNLFLKMVASRWTLYRTFRSKGDGEGVCYSVLNRLHKYRTEGLKLSCRAIWDSDLSNFLIRY